MFQESVKKRKIPSNKKMIITKIKKKIVLETLQEKQLISPNTEKEAKLNGNERKAIS